PAPGPRAGGPHMTDLETPAPRGGQRGRPAWADPRHRGHPPPQAARQTEEHGMAYDEGLATRVRELLDGEPGLAEMQMFGGPAFLLDGNMACGVRGDALLVRVDPAIHDTHTAEAGVRPDHPTRPPMKGGLGGDT